MLHLPRALELSSLVTHPFLVKTEDRQEEERDIMHPVTPDTRDPSHHNSRAQEKVFTMAYEVAGGKVTMRKSSIAKEHSLFAAPMRVQLRQNNATRQSCRLSVILLVVLLSPDYSPIKAGVSASFVSPSLNPFHSGGSTLCMAKGGGRNKARAVATAGGKKKKQKKSGTAEYHVKPKWNQRTTAKAKPAHTSSKASVVLPSSNSRGPPWQIMSSKDMKKNVESETERRGRIRDGLASSSEESSAPKSADRSSGNALLSPADRALLGWKRFSPDSPAGMRFLGAHLGLSLPPPLGTPEVAFLGRSNVGKSSLLNRLASRSGGGLSEGQEAHARVGKTPGATASVNMYALVDRHQKPLLGFVDLPGFGYAKLSKEQKASVEVAAERYLGKRNAKELALGILLVDIRRIPSDDDRAVLAALFDMGVPLVVVATKVDKVTGKERETNLKNIQLGLGLPDGQPLCISSVTGENTKQLWSIILDSCERKVEELQGVEEEFEEDDDEIYDDGEETWVDDEDLQYDQGYDWIQSGGGTIMYEQEAENDLPQQKSAPVFARSGEFRSPDADNDQENGDMNDDDNDEYYSESKQRMLENTERQIAENERFKLKNLKKTVREMERRGEI